MSASLRGVGLALLALAAPRAIATDGAADPVIGVDLGTTYSCVGVFQNGAVEIIANDQGNRVTPSYVAFTESERLVGDAAKIQASLNPENTVYDSKRLIGRRFRDEHVQADMQLWPFTVVEIDGGKPAVQVTVGGERKQLLPQEVSSMVLGKMRDVAEGYLGKKVSKMVVTVPAYFNDAQRQATKDAGRIAGLEVLRILNEPTAAAIAYGLDRKDAGGAAQTVLVFDLGGGTFDVSLLAIDSGVFEVLATAGDTHLGGEDFDNRLMAHLLELLRKKHPGKDPATSRSAVQKLRREAERAKRHLSTAPQVRIEIESLLPGLDFSETVTRAKFEELCADLFRQTLLPVERVLEDASLTKRDVDEVVLVGGSTRIPKVQALLTKFFNGKPPNKSINPDEAVAYGAAVQAGVLSGERDKSTSDLLLLDVTPLTLGIETTGGLMGEIIPRNTVIPTSRSKVYTTAEDNQAAVMNKVFEGERKLTKDNRLLGSFELTGIPPMPKGKAQIEMTFDVDVNGILSVTAKELVSGQRSMIKIEDSDRLDRESIDRAVRDAERFREEDEKAASRVASRNALESYIYGVKAALKQKELRSRMDDDDVLSIQNVIEEMDGWVDGNADASKEELDEQLQLLTIDTVGPLLAKYGASADGSPPAPSWEDEESEEDRRAHDEL